MAKKAFRHAVLAKVAVEVQKKSKLFSGLEFVRLCKKLSVKPEILEKFIENIVLMRLHDQCEFSADVFEYLAMRNFEKNKIKYETEIRLEIARKLVELGYDSKKAAKNTGADPGAIVPPDSRKRLVK